MAELGKVVQDQVHAPFTDEALKNIKAWQESGLVHELTCPHADERHGLGLLTPLKRGLVCFCCGYVQDWTPLIVADGTGLESVCKAMECLMAPPDNPQAEIARLRARVDELLRANNALVEDRRARDVALTKAAETFDFYAGHHREKLNANLDPRLTAGLKDKVDRNVDRAAMCRAARDHRTVPANG